MIPYPWMKTSSESADDVARFAGLSIWWAPYFCPTARMSGESVETKISSTELDSDAAMSGYSQRGLPRTSDVFFPGKPVLPPRPIISAQIMSYSLWGLDKSMFL